MHAPKNWYDHLEIENGQIVRILTAEWWHKNHPEDVYTCDVYKESDSGESWEQKLAEQDHYLKTLTDRQHVLDQEIEAQVQALEVLSQQGSRQNDAVAEQDAALRKRYLEQSEQRVRMQGITREREETEQMIRQAEADGSSVAERLQEYDKSEQKLKKQEESIQQKLAEQQNRLTGFRQLAGIREQKYQQAVDQLNQCSSEYSQVQQRQRILRDLEQNMEGYAGSVRQILKVAGSGRLGGVHGTVAQRITVAPEYGTAIETALGGALQNLIVENEETAKRCIRYLKEIRGGRATFLPLTTIKGSRLREQLEGNEGFVALACDLVGYDSVYRNVMENLLGRIAVAEDIDSATNLARKFGYRFRIVTLDGQVIHSGGSFTGGSAARSAGVITRTHELEEAAEKLKQLSAQQETLRADAAKRKAEWAKLLTDIEGAQATIADLQEQQNDVRQQVAALHVRAASDRAWQENEAEQRIRLTEKIGQLKQAEADAEAGLQTLESEIRQAEEQLRLDSESQTKLHSEQEMLTGEIAERKIRQAELAKDLENEQRRRIAMAQSMEQAADQIAGLQDAVKQEKANIAAKQREITQLTEGQDARRAAITDMQTEIAKLRQIHDAKEKHSREIQDGISALRDAREKQSAERTRVEERQNNVQREIDDLVFRLQDSYELTRTEAEAEAEPIENVKEAETQLSSLKNRIRALGTVNVAAVDEYKEVSERYAFMTGQIKDIETAKTELEQLIEQLTADMCVIFQESFNKINKYFGEIFVELFGGGSASLELTDPDHILESGIEIKVAPPGKVIKNLIALSGGEQSFVAICIYFAILKLRPAPFCILDEIDAALDEVNVRKYAQYLKHFFGQVQFVVVTHRRSAMDEANVLYGVTMQEDGVSRLLRLDQNGAAITD